MTSVSPVKTDMDAVRTTTSQHEPATRETGNGFFSYIDLYAEPTSTLETLLGLRRTATCFGSMLSCCQVAAFFVLFMNMLNVETISQNKHTHSVLDELPRDLADILVKEHSNLTLVSDEFIPDLFSRTLVLRRRSSGQEDAVKLNIEGPSIYLGAV